MANTVDLTAKTYTFTNNVAPVAYDCAGMRTGPDAIPEGTTATLHSEIALPMFGTNIQVVIPYGDTVKLTVATAEEAAHYLTVGEQLGLTVAEVSESD